MGTSSTVNIKYNASTASPTLAGLLAQLVRNAQLHTEETARHAEV